MNATAVDFVVDALRLGSVFGARLGDSLEAVTQHLDFDFVDQLDGRGSSRTLRRDFGLVESVFVDPVSWRCHAMFLQLHRFEHSSESIELQCRRHGVEISGHVQWDDVLGALGADADRWKMYEDQGNFMSFSPNDGATVVHVVNGGVGGLQHGDIWKVAMVPPFRRN